jgi:hypothetical protein
MEILSTPLVKFQEDVLLRALKFLETMVQRSSLEKTGFLKDLGTFWERFDQRVLMQRVGPLSPVFSPLSCAQHAHDSPLLLPR